MMDTVNILILVSAVIFLLFLWMTVGFRHLKYLKRAINAQWELLDESLRKRQNLLPNLIETVRIYVQDQETLIEKLIGERMKAAKEYSPGANKIEYEHDLSMTIKQITELEKINVSLAKDTNFLELTKEIDDAGKDIELQSNKYNEMVRYYNKHRNIFVLRPIAAIFKFGMMNIFEVEV